jgi:ATP-dependent Clp protease ATP-binding subunit ClpC
MNLENSYSSFDGSEDEPEKHPPKRGSDSKKSSTPVLDNFSRDLVVLALEGNLDQVIGRDEEITRIAQILSRRKKNNPVLIGDPGVGKTALVEGLAIKIAEGDCPMNLVDKSIVSLDLTSMVAGTKYRGQFEERMKAVIDELRENPDIVIFIDELHTVVGTGNSSGSLDAANIFKPALSRGDVQCIGATTIDEYRENIEKDGALERRFQKVHVDATSPEETLQILKQIRGRYEDHHKVQYGDEALELCVSLAERYITNREFPDKAIDILDEVGARAQVKLKYPEDIDELRDEIRLLKDAKVHVVQTQQYEKAAELRDKERKVEDTLEYLKDEWSRDLNENRAHITTDSIYEVVSQMTKIPLTKLSQNERENLLNIEDNLKTMVIGQDTAIKKIAKAIRRNSTGIRAHTRPIGTFMFLGSTGIGKTHLAKAIANELIGSPESLIRVDMSEYTEKFNTSRLIGSPPGYVGHNQGGQLTEAVRNKPYSVILFDEIEKSHRDVFDLLLQIFDEGHLTDGMGRKVNFKNTLIIMTSNVGSRKLQDFGAGIGFTTGSKDVKRAEEEKHVITKALKNRFSPEFLNRVDESVIFNALDEKQVEKITEIEVEKLSERLLEVGYKFKFNKSVIKHITENGFDEKYGARPIKRAIQDKLEDFISEEILKGIVVKGKRYTLSYDKKEDIMVMKSR